MTSFDERWWASRREAAHAELASTPLGFPVRPPPGPAEQVSLPIEEKGHRNHERHYDAWRLTEDGRRVWAEIVRDASEQVAAGATRLSAKALVENARRRLKVEIDNSHTCFIGRVLHEMKAFQGLIELRTRKGAA